MKKEEQQQAIFQTDPEPLLDLLDSISEIGRIADCLSLITEGLKTTMQSPEIARALHVIIDALELTQERIEREARKLFPEDRGNE